jgi:5-methylcytosine-specific restriction enzyme subunit McrC
MTFDEMYKTLQGELTSDWPVKKTADRSCFTLMHNYRYADDFGLRRKDICIQSEGCSKYLLKEEKSQSPKFKLQPDLLIKNGSQTRLILDTKWKCLKSDEEDIKNGVSSTDMYQMYAYATRYDCSNVILLYPDTGEVTPKSYRLLGYEDKRISVVVINLNRDLKKERKELLNNLSELLGISPRHGAVTRK